MGVNLAGVDIILRLKERLDELDSIIEELRENTKTPSQKELNILQIPRDLFVDTGYASRKANALYAYGKGPLMKSVLSETFGIPIDYYILVDPKGFVALVDELEGVDLTGLESTGVFTAQVGDRVYTGCRWKKLDLQEGTAVFLAAGCEEEDEE